METRYGASWTGRRECFGEWGIGAERKGFRVPWRARYRCRRAEKSRPNPMPKDSMSPMELMSPKGLMGSMGPKDSMSPMGLMSPKGSMSSIHLMSSMGPKDLLSPMGSMGSIDEVDLMDWKDLSNRKIVKRIEK